MGTLPPRELLTSTRSADGVWHAHYPTATLTLCGLPVEHSKQVGRRWPPDCGVCAKTARAFDRIEISMPPHWLPDSGRCFATAASTGERCERDAARGGRFCGSHRDLDRAAA